MYFTDTFLNTTTFYFQIEPENICGTLMKSESFDFSLTADKILGCLLTRGQGHLIEFTQTQQTVLTGSGQTTLPIMHRSSSSCLSPEGRREVKAANQLQVTFLQLRKINIKPLLNLHFFIFYSSFFFSAVLRSRPVRVIVLLIDAFTIIL